MQLKKRYVTPQLTIHGNVTYITQQGGIGFNDAPIGSTDIAMIASGGSGTT